VYEKPTAPAGIGGVLDDGLRLWRLSLPLTWGLALLAQAVKTAPSIFFPVPPSAVPPNLELAQRIMTMIGASSRSSLLAFVFGMISYIFVNAVLLRINSVCEHRQMSLRESLAAGLGLLLRTIGFFFLIGIGVALLIGVIVIVALAKSSSAGAQILMALVVMIVCVFLLYAAIRLVVGYPAMIVDDLSATDAIKASWRMTQGFWWRVTALLTVLGVIGLVLGAVLGIVAGGMAGLLGTGSRVAILVTQLVSILVYSFLGSLSPAVLLAVYNDLKLRREGGDLADRVSALASR
jgi:hypothetical protein